VDGCQAKFWAFSGNVVQSPFLISVTIITQDIAWLKCGIKSGWNLVVPTEGIEGGKGLVPEDMDTRARRMRNLDECSSKRHAPGNTACCVTQPASLLLTRLNDDLLARVLSFTAQWHVIRSISGSTRTFSDLLVRSLAIKPHTPLHVLHRVMTRVGENVLVLDLTGNRHLNDASLRHILEETCPRLHHLVLNYCRQLTPAVVPILSRVPRVAVRGCWRLLTPSPSLSSDVVLELQLLALQQNDRHRHDGVAKYFEFASSANRLVGPGQDGEEEGGEEEGEDTKGGGSSAEGRGSISRPGMSTGGALNNRRCVPGTGAVVEEGRESTTEGRLPLLSLRAFHVVYDRLQPLLGCQSFSIRRLQYESVDRACFLVRTTVKKVASTGTSASVSMAAGDGFSRQQHYLWLLSRQKEGEWKKCWLTDAIISAEHGLLSLWNLPLCEEGRGEDRGEHCVQKEIESSLGEVWLPQHTSMQAEGNFCVE